MYSLIALLFRKAYWRMLLRGATWSEAWVSLRRAHKDTRARKHLLGFARVVLIPFLCLAYCALYLAWALRLGMLILIPLVISIAIWRGRSGKHEDAPLHVVPGRGVDSEKRELTAEESRAVRASLGELTLFYAVMTHRAGSETFLKTKVLPENFEVQARRRHLQLLRRTGLWEKMAQPDREALMRADGHWDWSLINEVASYLEPLRLLRWMLRLDFYLPVVGRQLRGDFNQSYEVLESPDRVLGAKELVEVEQMERAQGAAREFYARCLAESLSRGYCATEDAEMERWARDLSASLHGKQNEDLLLGDRLVSETDQTGLLWATELARTRLRFLSWALPLCQGGALPSGPLSLLSQAAEDAPAEPPLEPALAEL